MSSQALIESMSRRVAEQGETLAADAQADAKRIIADAEAQAVAHHDQTIQATEAELAQLKERWERMAEAEAAKAKLAMKNESVEAVLAEVHAKMHALVESDGFGAVLEALLAELMEVAEGDILVLAPEAHVDRVKTWLASNGHGSVDVEGSASIRDGVAVQDPQRTYRISNTLSSRYARVDQEARKVCMTSLFEE